MIKNSILIIGIVGLFLFAMFGLTILPKLYIEPNVEKANVYVWGRAAEGHKVYVSHGCIYCHSQQVRPKGFGADIERGWGRASVATDYKGLRRTNLAPCAPVPTSRTSLSVSPVEIGICFISTIRARLSKNRLCHHIHFSLKLSMQIKR